MSPKKRMHASWRMPVVFAATLMVWSGMMLAVPSAGADGSLVTVNGTISLADGAPADGVAMVYFPGNDYNAPPDVATTDANGAYSMTVSPGYGSLYLETASANGSRCTDGGFASTFIVNLQQSQHVPACSYMFTQLTVNDGTQTAYFGSQSPRNGGVIQSVTATNLVLPAVVPVTLSVVDPSGNPVNNAMLSYQVATPAGVSISTFGSEVCTRSAALDFGPCFVPSTGLPMNGNGQLTAPNGTATFLAFSSQNILAGDGVQTSVLEFSAFDPANPVDTGSVMVSDFATNLSPTLQLSGPTTATGILTAGGVPVSGATVTFTPQGSPTPTHVQTLVDGSFDFVASPGLGTLTVQSGANQAQITSPTTLNLPSFTSSVEVALGADGTVTLGSDGSMLGDGTHDISIDLPPVSAMTIHVTNSMGRAAANAPVSSNQMNDVTSFNVGDTQQSLVWAAIPGSSQADASGDLALSVFDGPVQAFDQRNAIPNPYIPLDVFTADPNDPVDLGSTTITAFDTTNADVTISLPAPTTLNGQLLTSRGQPVENARVVFVPNQDDGQGSPAKYFATTTTDSNGTYEIPAAAVTGTIYFMMGPSGIALCPQGNAQPYLSWYFNSTPTVPALPPCSIITVPVSIDANGNITSGGATPVVTPNGTTLMTNLPPVDTLTLSTTDFTSGQPVAGVMMYEQESAVSPIAFSPYYTPGAPMFISWNMLGVTPLPTDSNGQLQLLAWHGVIDSSPNFEAVDPNNQSRDVALQFQGSQSSSGSTTMTFALPDAPQPPQSVSVQSAGASSAVANWTPPTSDGGSPVTGYDVSAVPTDSGAAVSGQVSHLGHVDRTQGSAPRGNSTSSAVTIHVSATQQSTTIPNLQPGVTYQIQVAANNIVGTSTAAQYTYVNSAATLSADNTLESLTVSSGVLTPSFRASTTSYSDYVANAVRAINLTGVVNDVKSSLALPGGSGASRVEPLNVGANVFTIVVTAQNGATKSYVVTINRAPSTDDTLKSLTITEVTKHVFFSSTKIPTQIRMPAATTRFTLAPSANATVAMVTINGIASSIVATKPFVVGLGQSKLFTIVVTAQSGARNTYRILVRRMK